LIDHDESSNHHNMACKDTQKAAATTTTTRQTKQCTILAIIHLVQLFLWSYYHYCYYY